MSNALTYAEIDLSAIAHNVRALRRATSPGARLMAVVKANGYGHGCVETARCALANGADTLGVARIEEGERLREAGIHVPILVFGYPQPAAVAALVQNDLTATIFSMETAQMLSSAATGMGVRIRAHLKIDTGMGRLGFLPDTLCRRDCDETALTACMEEISAIYRLKGLEIEGIYTHFACSDAADKAHTTAQFDLFMQVLERLSQKGIQVPLRHAANSAALLQQPETHLDMVRPGIAIYGLFPSLETRVGGISLKPAMSLKSRIVHLKNVPEAFTVSYGCTFRTDRDTRIATVPVGYGDGFNRLFSNRGQMLVRGIRAPVRGRVCMDLSMIEVGHIPDAAVGDEVVVFGNQGENEIHVDELARTLKTINYEIVTGISERVPRVYPTLAIT